jgi:uncharacterized protein (DUF2336 family)
MTKAVAYIEGATRAELSARLAPIASAPAGVIRSLACDDDIAVAGPVLRHSDRLTDEDLVEIAKSKSQDHLLELSGRSGLCEDVTDILVDRGDSPVRHKIAANAGARFSETGFSKLAIYAEDDEGLLATVARRGDIPPLLLRHVITQATDAVRERLMAQASTQMRAAVRKALNDVSGQLGKSITPGQYAEAQRRLASVIQDTALTKSKISEFAEARRMPEMIVVLSALCGVPIDLVDHLVNNASYFGVLTLCRAIGLDWVIAEKIVRSRLSPNEGKQLDTIELSQQYSELSASAARLTLRFWQNRQDHSSLAERVSPARSSI